MSKEIKRVILMDSFEHRLAVKGLTEFRNRLVSENKPTEDMDKLIIKVIDAPSRKAADHETR